MCFVPGLFGVRYAVNSSTVSRINLGEILYILHLVSFLNQPREKDEPSDFKSVVPLQITKEKAQKNGRKRAGKGQEKGFT